MIFGFLNDDLFDDRKSGDKKKQQSAVDQSVNTAQKTNELIRDEMIVPTTQNLYNANQQATANAFQDYGDIMGEYKNALSKVDSLAPKNVEASLVNYSRSPELSDALSGYGEFSRTGGFSSDDVRDLRARGVSPIRTAYQNALNDMSRRVNLQGGYSPNANILRARMARESGQAMADANQNVNAGIAEMRQKGQLSGLEGLGRLSVEDLGFSQRASAANQAAQLQAAGMNATNALNTGAQRLGALSGMSNLYSATPGQASTFGNQVLGSTQNWLNSNNQLSDIGQQRIEGQQTANQTPNAFQKGLGYAGQIGNIAGNIASIPFGGGATNILKRSPNYGNI